MRVAKTSWLRCTLFVLSWACALIASTRAYAQGDLSYGTDAAGNMVLPPPGTPLLAPVEPWVWQIRPEGFLYHTYLASVAEPKLSTQIVHESSDGDFQDSSIAGRIGIVRFGPRSYPGGWQLDVLGGAKLRQDWNEGLDVVAADFRYDILSTYAYGPHRFKLGFYHVSSHTGDEFLLKNPSHVRLNFFRDALVAGYSLYPIPELRLYAEAGWAFHADVSDPWEFQFGLDYGPAGPTGFHGAPFFAINGHLREELDFGGNVSVQAGWSWRGDQGWDGLFRTGIFYYNGGSPQFSFFREHEQQIGWGLWYDF